MRGRGCAREVPEADCCAANEYNRPQLPSRRGATSRGSRARHAPCAMALQPAPFREEAVIHGALPKVHMLLSPYLLPIDRRPRLFTLRVPFICLPVFRLALSRCERSQELCHAARHAAC